MCAERRRAREVECKAYLSIVTLPSEPCSSSNVAGSASCPNDRATSRARNRETLRRERVRDVHRAACRRSGANICEVASEGRVYFSERCFVIIQITDSTVTLVHEFGFDFLERFSSGFDHGEIDGQERKHADGSESEVSATQAKLLFNRRQEQGD